MKNAFILKALFVLKIFKKDKFNVEIYEVTTWFTNNWNTHIARYLIKEEEPDNEIWSINRT